MDNPGNNNIIPNKVPVTDDWTKLSKLPFKMAEAYKISSIKDPNVEFNTAPTAKEVWADKLECMLAAKKIWNEIDPGSYLDNANPV